MAIDHWNIQEQETLDEITGYGFSYVSIGGNWYDSDVPVSFNGKYKHLRSKGTRLTVLSNEEIEQREIAEFYRKVSHCD